MKKLIILHNELGEPIDVVEVKEYRSNEEIAEIVKICNENREKDLRKLKIKELELENEKKELKEHIASLELKILELEKQIKFILGEE